MDWAGIIYYAYAYIFTSLLFPFLQEEVAMVSFSITTELSKEKMHKCVLTMVLSHPFKQHELICPHYFKTYIDQCGYEGEPSKLKGIH